MRCSSILTVLSVGLLANHVTSGINIASILELGVRLVLLNVKRIGNLSLTDDTTLIIPEDIKDIIAGSIRLQNVNLYGFESLDIASLIAEDLATSDGSSKANLCLNLTIDQLGVETQYDADVGIINEVPIYGDGQLNLAISKTKVGLCLNINITDDLSHLYVDDFSLYLKFRDAPSSITRFWKNDGISEVVSAVINILETFVAMWISYEDECISCVLSPIVEYLVNGVLLNNDVDGGLHIQCSCLEGSFGNKYKLEDKLEQLVYSCRGDKMTNTFNSEDLRQFKEIFEIMMANIKQILNMEGISFDI